LVENIRVFAVLFTPVLFKAITGGVPVGHQVRKLVSEN